MQLGYSTAMKSDEDDYVRISTALGDMTACLFASKAPRTVAYFKHLVETGKLNNTSFYRIVSARNRNCSSSAQIEVIQGGHKPPSNGNFDFLEHETTESTKLTHKAYTLSMPRFKVGEVYKSFFITMRTEKSLDYCGQRHDDGQGFAAFGQLVDGTGIANRIFSRAEYHDFIKQEIVINTITRVSGIL